MTISDFNRVVNILKDDIRESKHLLKYHLEYDYSTIGDYREARKQAENTLEFAEGRLAELTEKYPEFFI